MIIPGSTRSTWSAFGPALGEAIGEGGLPPLWLDFTQSAIPLRALPYPDGSLYSFARASTVWCQTYDTASQALKWVEIPANIPPMPGMRWDSVNQTWSPYDANGNLIPASFRKGYWYLPQATNSLAYSRDITGTGWSLTNSPTIAQNAVGFDGVANKAWTITDSDTETLATPVYTLTTPLDTNTHTSIVRIGKDNDTSRFVGVRLWYSGGGAGSNWIQINTKTGEYAQLTSDSSGTYTNSILDEGNFWTVVQTLKNDGASSTLKLNIFPACGKTISARDAAATGSAVFDQCEIRLNTAFYDGSPIVTTGSALTRLAGDYRLSINNHNQAAGMILAEFTSGLTNAQLTSDVHRLLAPTTGSSPLYYRQSTVNSHDGTTEISSVAVVFGPDKLIKAAVRWSGTSRAVIVAQAESPGTYNGGFIGIGGQDIILGRNNTVPFYLKSLKYYTLDRGTAWIQGQQA